MENASRHIPYFNSECECLVVFILNTSAHQGSLSGVHWNDGYNSLSSRGLFRLAIMASAAAIIIAHNHPSGEPTPSEADIKITRDLIRPVNFSKSKFSTTL